MTSQACGPFCEFGPARATLVRLGTVFRSGLFLFITTVIGVENMQRGIVLSVAVLAFGLLCFFCIRMHAPMIQQDVIRTGASVLAANHIPSQGMSVDGRDVLLTGPAGSAQVSEATQKLAASVEGVRMVNVRTTDAQPDASTEAPPLRRPNTRNTRQTGFTFVSRTLWNSTRRAQN